MDPTPAHRRPALVALVVLASAACLGLGWWQWSRYESGSGSFQNLGYALQWPLFAVFVVYAYRRFVHLEAESDDPAEPSDDVAAAASRPRGAAGMTELPDDVLPPRRARVEPRRDDSDDPALAEYNAYLAGLDRDATLARLDRDARAGTDPTHRRTTP